jgi:hypothetical protein
MCVLSSLGCGCSGSPPPTWRTAQPDSNHSTSSSLKSSQKQTRLQLRSLRTGRRLNRDQNGRNEVRTSNQWAAVGTGELPLYSGICDV